MKVVVLGLGVSGKAAASFLKARGDEVLGVDRNVSSFDGMSVVSDECLPNFDGVGLCVKSPGIGREHPWIMEARRREIPVVGEIDLAFAELAKRRKRVLAVTGSNGKTTTTLLAVHFLKEAGVRAVAAGNVGVPLLSQIDMDVDTFVVELSSFQLEDMIAGPHFDAALILNITANHLDRYHSFEEYTHAKLRISTGLKPNGSLFVTDQVLKLCGRQMCGIVMKKVETISSLGYRDSCYRLFPHDLENASAAQALTGISLNVLKKGIVSFVHPPHRLEFVGEIAGVKYINDSKATSVDAVIKAVHALDGSLFVIAGGVDKGGAFSDWIAHFRGKVKIVFALGEAAGRIEQELGKEIKVQKIAFLKEGVQLAASLASVGDTILLSPGCSSYDQFTDYQHRGNTFTQIVKEML
jgi:UDP-N-acetylmuramoylalanine--D-glutamate ligase